MVIQLICVNFFFCFRQEVHDLNCLPIIKGSTIDTINDLPSAIQNDKTVKVIGVNNMKKDVISIGLM